MGEICKDPGTARQSIEAIEGSRKIIGLLVRSDGLATTLRLLQYTAEDIAGEIALPQNGGLKETAALYMKAAELLEEPYEKIKHELKI